MNFSTWIAAGLMIVVGAVWVIVFNAELLLGMATRLLGRIRRLAPVPQDRPWPNRLQIASARERPWPCFTLVVFTLVTGMASNGSFIHALQNVETFGGGFDVRASTGGETHITYIPAGDRQHSLETETDDFSVAASQSFCRSRPRRSGPAARSSRTSCAVSTPPLNPTTFPTSRRSPRATGARAMSGARSRPPGLGVALPSDDRSQQPCGKPEAWRTVAPQRRSAKALTAPTANGTKLRSANQRKETRDDEAEGVRIRRSSRRSRADRFLGIGGAHPEPGTHAAPCRTSWLGRTSSARRT